MAVHIINKLTTVQGAGTPVFDILALPADLQAAGQDGSVMNITSEIKGLSSAQYSLLQIEQMAGKVTFVKSATDVDVDPPELTIVSDTNVMDDAKTPRATEQTPASAVYFDSLGQPFKTILIDNPDGAFELELWGSIDTVNTAMADKRWSFIGELQRSDPGLHRLPPKTLQRLREFRFVKADAVRGVAPKVLFQSSF